MGNFSNNHQCVVRHRELDAIQDHSKRLELLLRGVFAGNIFDLGAASSADLFKSKGVRALLHATLTMPSETLTLSRPLKAIALNLTAPQMPMTQMPKA